MILFIVMILAVLSVTCVFSFCMAMEEFDFNKKLGRVYMAVSILSFLSLVCIIVGVFLGS